MPSVLVVIVNYRTPALVIDCLRSLADETAAMGNCRAVVVDNGSGDESAEVLSAAVRDEGWSGWCSVQPLAGNRGFAAGNNAAILPALAGGDPPDYLWLLNPDTVVRPGAGRELISFLESRPDVGIAGSRLEDPDGTPQRSAFRFPGVLSEFEGGVRLGPVSRVLERFVVAPPVRDDAHRTGWVAGASMMVRRAVFDAVGGFDEDYFLYFEETDFCLRAARRGWACWYVPASRVVHLVGQSSGVTNASQIAKRIPAYWFESRRRYFERNHGWLYGLTASAAWFVGFVAWRVRATLQRKRVPEPDRLLSDFVRYNFVPWAAAPGSGP